jgi:hypothetical protein
VPSGYVRDRNWLKFQNNYHLQLAERVRRQSVHKWNGLNLRTAFHPNCPSGSATRNERGDGRSTSTLLSSVSFRKNKASEGAAATKPMRKAASRGALPLLSQARRLQKNDTGEPHVVYWGQKLSFTKCLYYSQIIIIIKLTDTKR